MNDNEIQIHRGSGDVFADLGVDISRCDKTGHLVGTDTWGDGYECPCIPCQVYVKGHRKTAGQIALSALRQALADIKRT